ncbi:HD-GYP domain-containing protein [Clostridium estertheticum]|uniref:HD-GYP domain-containing protein n=1 Tax=Clostridium estertheticum TaxID=238834 RepID=UPI001C6E1113|nr:HD-GYP domain-containing protein [Clostridium estertheticum]MBW9171527.1 HD-GYP domain-containing protein [Clostridium estertheticum]MBX4264266.1 HD-GYP domain-containing protein [Clostridium estertheticum]MBX4267834.1 HD-GYP domain-containing protein [Clostridium estertheticum]WLC77028.1 HD-GYP domain-containing protein [Clostridium estertheticum]WLC78072.1 HD-GYP domain-containing protein [Clostridium estertheticum]
MLGKLLSFFRNKEVYHDIIESLVAALEAKDAYTSGHSQRVSDMAYKLSKGLGIRGVELQNIDISAHLHDIGKIGVPDKVLNKNGKLLPHEWEYIKMHPKIGFDILNKSKGLKSISENVLYHHERWDGKGYPKGLSGIDIPLGSRVIAVCDSIDAMTSVRPYRQAMGFEECIKEITINSGLMFDPVIVQYIEENINTVRKFLKPKNTIF